MLPHPQQAATVRHATCSFKILNSIFFSTREYCVSEEGASVAAMNRPNRTTC